VTSAAQTPTAKVVNESNQIAALEQETAHLEPWKSAMETPTLETVVAATTPVETSPSNDYADDPAPHPSADFALETESDVEATAMVRASQDHSSRSTTFIQRTYPDGAVTSKHDRSEVATIVSSKTLQKQFVKAPVYSGSIKKVGGVDPISSASDRTWLATYERLINREEDAKGEESDDVKSHAQAGLLDRLQPCNATGGQASPGILETPNDRLQAMPLRAIHARPTWSGTSPAKRRGFSGASFPMRLPTWIGSHEPVDSLQISESGKDEDSATR
jgi:hypothetical protein